MMVPHGSSVYSYHFVITRHNSPFAEFLMMHPGPTEVVPMFAPQLLGAPVPVNGRIRAGELDRPGLGVDLTRDIPLPRTHPTCGHPPLHFAPQTGKAPLRERECRAR